MNVIAVKPAGAELHRLGDDIPAGALSGAREHGHQFVALGDGESRSAVVGQEHAAIFVFLRRVDVDSRRERIVPVVTHAFQCMRRTVLPRRAL